MFLTVGDFAPDFIANTTSSPEFHFNTVGGYRIILSFLGRFQTEASYQVIQHIDNLQANFNSQEIVFFGVTTDPADQPFQDWITYPTVFKLIWDFDRRISRLYEVCSFSASQEAQYTPTTFVLNQNLQILGVFQLETPEQHIEQVLNCAQKIPVFAAPNLASRQAPILRVPNVLEPKLCQHLINLYEADGGTDSGFMREIEGKTVLITEPSFKKRRDLLLEDPGLLAYLNELILRRVKPEIEKAFQFSISRFERYLVACYEAHNQGFFNRHRDNTTKGTAHRRFAMSLNLNTGEYEGGNLWFPEYGSQLFAPEVGEAAIFSCSLLHEATPVTQGRRFVLLSFFYNDEDARIRERNQKYIVLNEEQSQNPFTRNNYGFQPEARKTHKASKKRR